MIMDSSAARGSSPTDQAAGTAGPRPTHPGALRVTRLDRLMALTEGSQSVTVGLLDGPVATGHPGFAAGVFAGGTGPAAGGTGPAANSPTARHGTAVAGVLVASRDSGGPGICPGCRVVVCPVFGGSGPGVARPTDVAAGLVACLRAGARLINISAAFVADAPVDHDLRQALDLAARRGVLVVAAAGNSGRVGGSPLVSHPWVVPVTSCDELGRPLADGNVGSSIGRRGLRAPGSPLPSLAPDGAFALLGGTSLSTALVTGAVALSWSAAPDTPAALVRRALSGAAGARRTIVPPLLDALSLYESIS
jgi:hypothetical protein